MKVEAVEAFAVRVKMEERLRGGTFVYPDFQATMVRASCDGVQGWGEAMSRSDPRVNAILVEHLSLSIVGKEFESPLSAWTTMWSQLRVRGHTRGEGVEALSGIEIALQDCAARTAGKSVAGLLGEPKQKVPALAGSLFESRGRLSDQVEASKLKGLRGAKVKVGFGVDEDVRMLREVRKAWPEGMIVADANGAYDSTTAPKILAAVAGLGLAWFEEPVLSDDLEGYRSLRGSNVRIGAGESWFVSDFDAPLEEGLVGVLEPSVSRCGGIGVEDWVSGRAEAKGLGFSPMTGMNSGVSLAASMQVAAVRGTEGVEFNPFINPLQTELVQGLDQPRNGWVSLPRGPGLGVEVDLGFLKKHQLGI